MNTFEQLEEQACKDGIDVTDRKLGSERIKGIVLRRLYRPKYQCFKNDH